ncbi:hypothetical protein LTR35_015593 [Friedmanniomyces endolithicus]|uniref:Deacetylase sirtuin-type domain-containing protein n=1 Tax=Friedmanniomyces endolithicus TaxID=329885 RepID=A0AAN6FCB7_9PEZI|nr:hypothetical protein LTR35_015593 [Friedmanniomyces endolithicus]KAK0276170.1 hypothetical protein LTS00_014723 [Friedmanniomyces endolithicus]KAK0309089.1 hypothetical protein LTR82_015375 [Friedmanniomyces endolithicus]KAK0980522.1 hypothetical protein LTR54_015334 [Friedmanniomyces endolithicus]
MADPDTDSDLSSLPSLSPSPPPEDRSISPPSSPLSFLSRSPTPTSFLEADRASMANRPHVKVKILVPYPSPPASQQTSASGSPSPDGMDSGIDGRPAKRRRISRDPKNRTTEYLDLRSGTVSADHQENLDRVLDTLLTRRKIVAIAGAGMSRSAGVPDFRSKEGLFSSLKKEHNLKGSGQHLFDASVYKNDASTEQFHSMISQMSRLTKDAQPTQFHHMLATMAQDDRLLRLYSQNVDGLDTNMEPLRTRTPLTKDAHGKWPRTVQLHGGLDKMVCTKCREVSDLNADLFDGQDAPLCPTCEVVDDIRTVHEGKRSHGIGRLRPRMVLYHEQGPDENAIGNCSVEDLRRRPDAVIVVGTTLKVPGLQRLVKEMCKVVRNRKDGGLAIWINPDPPPAAGGFRECFDIIVQGTCDEVAKRAAMRKWNEPALPDDFSEVSEEDALKIAAKNAQVRLPKCQLTHASVIRLPSAEHKNNSFRPPPRDTTPSPVMDHGPKDWSPISSRHSSIFSTIEVGENIVLGATIHGGLATPKSSRSTPVKANPTAFDQLTDKKARKALGQSNTSSAMSKKIAANAIKGVKIRPKVKTAASKSKSQLSTAKTASITNAFTQSKSASTAAKSAGAKMIKDAASSSPAKSPSKLREVSNASAAADEPVSPAKAKKGGNGSLGKAKSALRVPNLAVGGAERGSKRKCVGA